MTCTRIPIGGGVAIVCTRGDRAKRCAGCGRPATKACDWKLHGPKTGKTCDAPVCDTCATHVGPDKDLCPAHGRAWEVHPANPERKPRT